MSTEGLQLFPIHSICLTTCPINEHGHEIHANLQRSGPGNNISARYRRVLWTKSSHTKHRLVIRLWNNGLIGEEADENPKYAVKIICSGLRKRESKKRFFRLLCIHCKELAALQPESQQHQSTKLVEEASGLRWRAFRAPHLSSKHWYVKWWTAPAPLVKSAYLWEFFHQTGVFSSSAVLPFEAWIFWLYTTI